MYIDRNELYIANVLSEELRNGPCLQFLLFPTNYCLICYRVRFGLNLESTIIKRVSCAECTSSLFLQMECEDYFKQGK